MGAREDGLGDRMLRAALALAVEPFRTGGLLLERVHTEAGHQVWQSRPAEGPVLEVQVKRRARDPAYVLVRDGRDVPVRIVLTRADPVVELALGGALVEGVPAEAGLAAWIRLIVEAARAAEGDRIALAG